MSRLAAYVELLTLPDQDGMIRSHVITADVCEADKRKAFQRLLTRWAVTRELRVKGDLEKPRIIMRSWGQIRRRA